MKRWSVLYKNILSDVTKNAVAVYMVEVLQKSLKQPEANADLFHFCENAFLNLDTANDEITANFPIYFSLQLAPFLGIGLQDNYSEIKNVFNIPEGNFSDLNAAGSDHLSVGVSYHIAQLLKAIHPESLTEIKMNRNMRQAILKSLENYYGWHVPEFGSMKTLAVLSEVIG
jgi:DNA repair protein RecO (recombination protein O)